jgi:hypothetical protein
MAASRIFFGADQPLTHGRRRNQKCGSDARSANAEHRLQHQRRARGGINSRMRAHEKKFQPFVGEMVVRCRDDLRFLGDLLEKLLGIFPVTIPARWTRRTGN